MTRRFGRESKSISLPSVLTLSPYRISTSERTDHTVTGMEKHLDVKITLRRINLQKKCRKKKYDNIHDRYIRDKTFRKAMIEVGRSEKIILEMDQLASEDHTHVATRALSSIMGDEVFPLCFGFPMTIAMRSLLLDDIIRN